MRSGGFDFAILVRSPVSRIEIEPTGEQHEVGLSSGLRQLHVRAERVADVRCVRHARRARRRRRQRQPRIFDLRLVRSFARCALFMGRCVRCVVQADRTPSFFASDIRTCT